MYKPSPATLHRQHVLASIGGRVLAASGVALEASGGNDNAPGSHEANLMMVQLLDHKRSLKDIKSTEGKVALKRQILPLYEGWVSGILAGDRPDPDEVTATIMVWRLDAGDYAGALAIAAWAIKHQIPLPPHVKRDPATFVVDVITEDVLKFFALGEVAVPAAQAFGELLGQVEELVDGIDMHDEVRAKLEKAIGKCLAAGGDESRARQEATLKRYLRALELHDGSGVKKDIDALNRALKKPETISQAAAPLAPSIAAGAATAAKLHPALTDVAAQNSAADPAAKPSRAERRRAALAARAAETNTPPPEGAG